MRCGKSVENDMDSLYRRRRITHLERVVGRHLEETGEKSGQGIGIDGRHLATVHRFDQEVAHQADTPLQLVAARRLENRIEKTLLGERSGLTEVAEGAEMDVECALEIGDGPRAGSKASWARSASWCQRSRCRSRAMSSLLLK